MSEGFLHAVHLIIELIALSYEIDPTNNISVFTPDRISYQRIFSNRN